MRKLAEQASFLSLLVKLMSYMVSGQSHIGYFCNTFGNPYVPKPVFIFEGSRVYLYDPVLYDCVVVELWRTRRLEDNSEGELDGESDVEVDADGMVVDS